jgi:hypothetical protein
MKIKYKENEQYVIYYFPASASYMIETVQGGFITTLDKYDTEDMKELKNYL